jgi:ABC-type Zn uptake system ZnuABC Zn-binding protein ZnuA
MKRPVQRILHLSIIALLLLSACGASPQAGTGALKVVAVETFLADIAQNVAGSRLTVDVLLPIGVDPHSFEPVPSDLAKVAASTVLIVNGGGLEEFLDKMLTNAGGQRLVVEASAGLARRAPRPGEPVGDEREGDPHFWLDPSLVVTYARNIRDGLTEADPAGAATYAANAESYILKLNDLDVWVKAQVASIPEQNRLLVTNHETLGYFADRYGFTIVGAIVASVSTSASPSAQELAQLVRHIEETGAKAIFLDTGTNPQLAQQVAQDSGVKVIQGLYTHSISKGGPAPTYTDMMRVNTRTIVDALR